MSRVELSDQVNVVAVDAMTVILRLSGEKVIYTRGLEFLNHQDDLKT